jgi:Asp-tRNA(Asn)/Glu-tRNA(Gln) amidotransferase A subunit family amidase
MAVDRRHFLAYFASAGLGATLFPAALWAQAAGERRITREMLAAAEKVAGVSFSDSERDLMLQGLDEALDSYEKLRAVPLDNAVPPAFGFQPARGGEVAPRDGSPSRWSRVAAPPVPSDLEELAFRPVTELAALLRARRVTSLALTEMYLARLKRFAPVLHCVITLTEERARAQARVADAEIARGHWRGPLHGIPWGVKDLLSVRGHPTTWGARPYRDQTFDLDATVVRRLDDAGAVLLAKLSCGALAWGDVWYGGTTRNPWQPDHGSSGSSAGSAAAVAAGLVGFAIGTETYGSIVSPATRCGATGLRPTFGRVSRHGCMALSWSLDKIGPLARAAEDCALVFDAIRGADPQDPDAADGPFRFDARLDPRDLRVGWLEKAFAETGTAGEAREWQALDVAALDALRGLGVTLRPVEWPAWPVEDMMILLTAEAGAAFDAFSRGSQDDELVRQSADAWPNVLRQARLIPAVEYIAANRIRTLLLRDMARLMADYDVVISPTFGAGTLALTNLSGHPEVVMPSGFRADGTPVSITLVAGHDREGVALALAKVWQESTGWHRRHPPAFAPGAPAPAPLPLAPENGD